MPNLAALAPPVAWVVLVGCGSVSRQPNPDAAQQDAVQGRCNPTAVFAAPQPIAELNTAALEYEGRLSPDELTIWFLRDTDILVATRSDLAHSFGMLQAVTALNTDSLDAAPTVTADGLTVYLDSNRPGGVGGRDIWVATRASLASEFPMPTLVKNINTTVDDYDSYVTPDGSALYWTVGPTTSEPGLDVYTARLGPAGFSGPVLVGGLPSSGNDSHIIVSPDQRTAYWASDRSDPAASGNSDIWTATRASTSDPFGAPHLLTPLNSPSFDEPTWISPDGCDLYVQSDRAGTFDLYVAHRQ